jgi:hypothetical protein
MVEYQTYTYVDEDSEIVEVHRYPVGLLGGSPMTDPTIAPVETRIVRRTITRRVRKPSESPSQDTLTKDHLVRVPKTLGDTNEFIRAFWINGKPKCRDGYRYDFRRKMCRLIK